MQLAPEHELPSEESVQLPEGFKLQFASGDALADAARWVRNRGEGREMFSVGGELKFGLHLGLGWC